MKDFAMIIPETGGLVSVDWSTTVSGIANVKQKLINSLTTNLGSDRIVPTRGTELLRQVVGGNVFNLRSAQHSLNFAALRAKRNVRDFEEASLTPAERVQEFRVVYREVIDGHLITDLSISTMDGSRIGDQQAL